MHIRRYITQNNKGTVPSKVLYMYVHGYDMHICAFAFLNIRRYHIYITLFIYIGVIELLSKRNLMCVRLLKLTTFLEGSHGVPVSLLASLFSPWYLLPPLPHHQKVLPIFCSTSFFDYNWDRMLPHHCRPQHCRRGPRACAGSKSTSYNRSS